MSQGFTGSDAKRWYEPRAPLGVAFTNSGGNATYQAASTAVNKLHVFSANCGVFVQRGTGASVTAANKVYVAAGVKFPFVPCAGAESIGYARDDASDFDATHFATIGVVEVY